MSFARSLAVARVARRSYSTAAEEETTLLRRRLSRPMLPRPPSSGARSATSLYVCAPIILVGAVYVKRAEDAHHAHLHEHGRTEVPAYQYLNIRNRPFPWGMNSLFWNPETQRDMEKSE
ncbi:Cytochrome c oxidase subunit 6A [Rhizoctonia solani]